MMDYENTIFNNAINTAVKKWVTSLGVDFYKYIMQALIQWGQKCIEKCGKTVFRS